MKPISWPTAVTLCVFAVAIATTSVGLVALGADTALIGSMLSAEGLLGAFVLAVMPRLFGGE